MVKIKTVDGWNLPAIGVTMKNEDDVENIFCKICKEYYTEVEDGKTKLDKLVGNVKRVVLNWVGGSTVIKKNNAKDHLKANYHLTAVRILRERAAEKAEAPQQTEAERLAAATSVPSEESILVHVRQLNQNQREQLLKKFQLAHFVVIRNLSFNMYHHIAVFEKEHHKVDLGNAYTSNKSGREIAIFLSNSLLKYNVVKPLNDKRQLYFSLLYDGSSSAKTNDEKKLYVIKTCKNGSPKFDILSLQQPEDTNAEGLHMALQRAVSNAKFTFPRKDRLIGVGSDGASANKSLYKLEKAAVGDHLVFSWCLSHKLELALHDAFKSSNLDSKAQKQLELEFYLFKKATLKWRLFKRYAEVCEKTPYRYKRPDGTRWVSHQLTAISIHLRNLPTMLAFSNEQVEMPYNNTMKKEKARMEGIRKDASSLQLLIYQAVRYDIMAYSVPCSLTLEKSSLLMPEAITSIETAISTLLKLSAIIEEEGVRALRKPNLFPTLNKDTIPHLRVDEAAPVPNEMAL